LSTAASPRPWLDRGAAPGYDGRVETPGDGRSSAAGAAERADVRGTSEQRARLTQAMLGSVAGKGYAATTVTDVVRGAGVSRATFYELFPDKEACFLAAYDELIAALLGIVEAEFAKPGSWTQRTRAALEALLANMAENPHGARVALKEALDAGPAAHARFREGMGLFVRFVEEGRELCPRSAELPPNVSRVVVGGVAAVIAEEVAAGNVARLNELLPELLYNVLAPIVGREIAWKEMRDA
jgi:AcrR family transcriptional regulator